MQCVVFPLNLFLFLPFSSETPDARRELCHASTRGMPQLQAHLDLAADPREAMQQGPVREKEEDNTIICDIVYTRTTCDSAVRTVGCFERKT